jgi:uncharacterized protein
MAFFSGPINFDTIEAILRSKRYLKTNTPSPSPVEVAIAALKRKSQSDKHIVDKFWGYKADIYNLIIRSKQGIIADYLCQYYTTHNIKRLSRADFFISERAFFRKMPELRAVLKNMRNTAPVRDVSYSVRYKQRHFFVNEMADFFARDDENRYKQSKSDHTITAGPPGSRIRSSFIRDLFDVSGSRKRKTT